MQVTIRASSLPELFDCPARWEARNLRQMYRPSTSNAAIGHAVHKGTAVFDQSRLEGRPLTINEAASTVVDAIRKPEEETLWDETTPDKAENISLTLYQIYCRKIAPTHHYVAIEAQCDT